MSEWHINPFPAHAQPIDWTGKSFSADDLRYGDFWNVGRITFTVRADDFHVHVDGDRRKWACGRTVNEALGSLLSSHLEILLGPPALRILAAHLVDEADLDGSAGSYCEVSRDTIANLKSALEAK